MLVGQLLFIVITVLIEKKNDIENVEVKTIQAVSNCRYGLLLELFLRNSQTMKQKKKTVLSVTDVQVILY